MRYRAMFAAGFAVGFVAGTRAGRERYDQMVKYGRQIAGSPTVKKVTQTVTVKTTELTKTAAAKAPDLAKTASARVPRIVSSARHAADRIPPRMRKNSSSGEEDDVAADGHLVYPADGETPVNGVRYAD